MKKIVVKCIIAIAIGVIAGQVTGKLKEKDRYYALGSGEKYEITKERYDFNTSERNRKHEKIFNKSLSYFITLVTASGIIIILLIPDLFSKKVPRTNEIETNYKA